ncbi:Protein OS-9, partial [Cymbomonas tetramitiformis]
MLWRRSSSLTALCGLLTATSTLFTISVNAETVIVPVSPPSFMAEKKEPKYLITMSKDLPESEEISAGERDGDVVLMTDKNGQRYACKLPVLQGDGETSDNEDEIDSSSGDILNRPKTVTELLDSLGKACFFRVEGWWTYELCYHKHVRQYHSEREQVLSEFFLGHYDGEATKEFHAAQPNPEYVEDGGLGLSQRFHTHIYTNGTKCDLTGEGRQTE